MGKASKKVKRQAQKKTAAQKLQQCQPQELKLAEAFATEEYAQVLELLAELIKVKDIKPDLLYKGAYSYFMLGDYERAAQWVNNTLNYDPQHVEARILLARLCFIQDRDDDGLAIYEFLAANFLDRMTQEQKEQIKDSSEYYVRRDREKLQKNYPHLSELLQVKENVTATESAETATEPAASGALSALQRLKAKLQAVQAKHEETPVESTPVTEKNVAQVNNEQITAEKQIAEIQERACSLREKVQIFNKFAAAAYIAADYPLAESYLKAALQLDDGDTQTVRNMAMVQAAMGNGDKAQALAARLPEVDFAFLYLLKEQTH